MLCQHVCVILSLLYAIGMTGDFRKPGPVYYLPYRCLVGRRVSNLLAAGRCISVTTSAWDITRVIPACAVTGEAAGTAAALAASRRIPVASLPIRLLQRRLLQQGAMLRQTVPTTTTR